MQMNIQELAQKLGRDNALASIEVIAMSTLPKQASSSEAMLRDF